MPVLSLSGPNAAGSAAYRFSVPGQLAQLARDSWLGATAGAADRLPYLGWSSAINGRLRRRHAGVPWQHG
jgi:hypothetical protein